MICPFCLSKRTDIYNSRPTKKINSTWRRRRCANCKKEFTTRETIDPESIIKINDGLRKNKSTNFSRAHLLTSLLKICDHQNTQENAYWLCETIEQKLILLASRQNGIISKKDIIETNLSTLKQYDTSAFIKYLTHYSKSNLNMKSLKKYLQ